MTPEQRIRVVEKVAELARTTENLRRVIHRKRGYVEEIRYIEARAEARADAVKRARDALEAAERAVRSDAYDLARLRRLVAS